MKRTLYDLATLAARMGVGGIFFANGWQKLEAGLNATGDQFTELGAPAPEFWAAATMLIELLGGTLLIAGLAVGAIGVLLFAEALSVFILAAGDPAMPLAGGSVQLIVALGAASVLLSVNGAGRLSVDHMVVIKRRDALAEDEFRADADADAVIDSLREPGVTKPHETRPAADPKGPVTFAAKPGEAADGDTVPKRKPRPPRRTDETTESRSEPKTDKPEKAAEAKDQAPESRAPQAGDTLVAGRRSGSKSG